jgi:hypothetical protein
MGRMHWLHFRRDEAEEDADRQTTSLAALALVLLLVVVGLYVVKELSIKSAVEDCLLAHRSNCDAILSSRR